MAPDCEISARSPAGGIRAAKLALSLARRRQNAKTIGSDEPQAGCARGPLAGVGKRTCAMPKPRGDDDCSRHAFFAATPRRCRGTEAADAAMTSRSGAPASSWMVLTARDPLNLAVVWIDEADRPFEPGAAKIFQDRTPGDVSRGLPPTTATDRGENSCRGDTSTWANQLGGGTDLRMQRYPWRLISEGVRTIIF